MYSITNYASMMRDKVRIEAYTNALRTVISESTTVLDLGAGTGIISFIAAQLGAKHVYAVETNPYLYLGQVIADANGLSKNISFIKGSIDTLTIPQVDIIVADIRGQLPFIEDSLSVIISARENFLKPAGTLLPYQDRLLAALITTSKYYDHHILNPWGSNPYQINMKSALPFQTSTPFVVDWYASNQDKFSFLTEGQVWATIDYGTVNTTDFEGQIECIAQETGIAHFIMLWFETTLLDNIGYSSGPFKGAASVYGKLLLPLARPVQVNKGDTINIALKAYFRHHQYDYDWQVSISNAADPTTPQISLKQSTRFSRPPRYT